MCLMSYHSFLNGKNNVVIAEHYVEYPIMQSLEFQATPPPPPPLIVFSLDRIKRQKVYFKIPI